ncbi:MAG: E2/UBC family protein [Bacillota bacterium]
MNLDEIILCLNDRNSERFSNFKQIPTDQINTARSITNAIECTVNLSKRNVTLQIGLSHLFPYVLPFIFLKECDVFTQMVPHVEENGYICFLSSEGLLLNADKIPDIILESLEMALRIIEDGLSGRNRDDLYNEFEAFWRRIGDTKRVVSLVKPQTDFGYKSFFVWTVSGQHNPQLLFCDDKEDGKRYAKQVFSVDLPDSNVEGGYFLILRPGTHIKLEQLREKLTPKIIRHIVQNNLSGSIRKRFFKHIKKQTVSHGKKEYLLLGVPQPDGNISLVGIEFNDFRLHSNKKGSQLKHPLDESLGYTVNVVPLTIERHYQDHLVLRTGGDIGFTGKKVIVLGAGAIGSRIVGELIHAGVSDVAIVDNDIITADNLYRHEVGVIYLYQNKAKAVSAHFKFKYPLAKVLPLNKNVYDILMDKLDILEKFDLIISALGNPTMEMLLNRKLRDLEKPPPIIFTWVEPLGIGGHAIASLNNNRAGCYECLHTNPVGPTEEFINRASFAAPRQTFTKTVAGCGTQFTPYGSLDALQTAILATRLAIDIMIGKELYNPLVSWKGEPSKFLEAGFALSDRHKLSQEYLIETRYKYITGRCKTCSGEE